MTRVLISAYACEPNRGSEPGVGWNLASELAREHDVWVLTRANNRGVIERALSSDAGLQPKFEYLDLPDWARWFKQGPRGVQLYYYLWQLAAWRRGRHLHRVIGFDIVHHLTFARYWTPAPVGLIGPPFVWGPVGGGDRVPRHLAASFSPRGRLRNSARSLARWIGERDPLVRACARNCAAALGTTAQTVDRLRSLGIQHASLLPNVAIAESDLANVARPRSANDTTVHFLSVGTLASLKGFHLGVEAFARSGASNADYTIIGAGPERGRLAALIRKFGLDDRVHLRGEIPREAVLEAMATSDVLLHPSLQDSGGMVCLEAMAARMPVVCVDLGGPAELTDASCAIRVSPADVDSMLDGLAGAIRRLAADRDLRAQLGAAGRRRVEERFRWRSTARALSRVYQSIEAGLRQPEAEIAASPGAGLA